MFFKKKRSWQIKALWSLVFSGIIYGIAQFFLYAVTSNARKKGAFKKAGFKEGKGDELFI